MSAEAFSNFASFRDNRGHRRAGKFASGRGDATFSNPANETFDSVNKSPRRRDTEIFAFRWNMRWGGRGKIGNRNIRSCGCTGFKYSAGPYGHGSINRTTLIDNGNLFIILLIYRDVLKKAAIPFRYEM